MLNLTHYTFSWYAVPTALTTLLLVGLGVAVLIRERASPTSLVFASLITAITIWLFSFTLMYCTEPAWLALRWAKAAYLGVPFIPAAIYHFTASVLGIARSHRPLIWTNWVLAALFAGTILGTDTLISRLYEYWWGYYPGYGWLSVPYLTFFFGTMILSLRLYWRAYRRAEPGTLRHRCIRLLLIAFSIVYLGSFDYVAKYGVALYPFGYLAVLGFAALTARAIWKYRLVDLTPAFAARQISNTMVTALIVADHDGFIRIVNQATCELVGAPEDQLIGRRLDLATRPPLTQAFLDEHLRNGAVRDCELSLSTPAPAGADRTLSLSASAIMDTDGGGPLGTVCVLSDITARKRAEQDLRHLHETTVAVNACQDFPSALGVVVRMVCETTGWDCGEAWIPDTEGLRWCDAAWHTRHPRLETFRNVSSTITIPVGAGIAGHVAQIGQPEWVRDLTTQEPRLYSRRARLATALDLKAILAVPIVWEGEVLAVLCFFMRQSRDEDPRLIAWVSTTAAHLGLVMARKRAEEALRRARNNLELRVHERTEELAGANRALQAYVDELRRAEQEVRESEVRFRTMANAAPVMIWQSGLDKRCTYFNPRWLEFTGRALEQELGDGWAEGVHPQDLERCVLTYHSAFDVRENFRMEYRLRRADGEYRWLLDSGAPRFTEEGEFIGYIGSCIDITDRKQAEEDVHRSRNELERRVEERTEELAAANRALEADIAERTRAEEQLKHAHAQLQQSHEELKQAHLHLIQAAKMESVGRLAAGVAHEVKNPLAVILQGVDYLARHIPKEDGNSSIVLKHTADAVRRADAVVRGLLNFSATRDLDVAPADLHAVLDQALMLVKHELDRARIIIVRATRKNLPPVQLDANKMEQVFVNLFMNAAQAMPDGGTLTIRTSTQRLTRVSHDVGARRRDRFRIGEDVVVIEIDDTGPGIPESAMDKIFDPFFTTKPTGKGTGLGLTVTKKIVELHGGMLTVVNRRDGGVRATVVLRSKGGHQNGQDAHPAD